MSSDVALTLINTGERTAHYDIDLDSSGDIAKTDGFDTAILMSFFCERRADESEVTVAELRRGWVGNSFPYKPNFEIGSRMWLLMQARRTDTTLNKSIDYSQQGFDWFLDDDYLSRIAVDSEFTSEGIKINADFFRSNNLVDSRSFDLWENTGVTE